MSPLQDVTQLQQEKLGTKGNEVLFKGVLTRGMRDRCYISSVIWKEKLRSIQHSFSYDSLGVDLAHVHNTNQIIKCSRTGFVFHLPSFPILSILLLHSPHPQPNPTCFQVLVSGLALRKEPKPKQLTLQVAVENSLF